METPVRFDGDQMTVAELLRFQPFFLFRSSGAAFTFLIPSYHLKASMQYFADNTVIPMLLMATASPSNLYINEPWRVFENLPAHIVAAKAATDALRGDLNLTSWDKALPTLFSISHIASLVKFDLGLHPYQINVERDDVFPHAIENDPMKFVRQNGAVMPKNVSSSGDLFHVQPGILARLALYVALFEWQQTFFCR
jgi:hypothetical protein